MITDEQQEQLNAFSEAAMDIASKCWHPGDAQKRKRLQPQEVAAAIADECNVSMELAYSWIRGKTFPSEIQCEFMMDVLTKSDRWRNDRYLLGGGNALLDQRDDLDDNFGGTPPPAMSEEEMQADLIPKKDVSGSGRGHSGKLVINDTIGFEPRKHPDLVAGEANPVRYEALKPETLKEIQATTKNLPEFLTVSRLLVPGGMRQEDLARIVFPEDVETGKTVISLYEIGESVNKTRLPNPETLNKLLDTLLPKTGHNPLRVAARKMLCRNRAQLAWLRHNNTELDNAISVGAHEALQPAAYFKEKLRRRAGGNLADSPDWANDPPIETVPIERTYQYVRNIRGALGVTKQQIAELTGYSLSAITSSESYDSRDDHTHVHIECLREYQRLAAERDAALTEKLGEAKAAKRHISPYISVKEYKELPKGPLISAAEREAARQAAGNGQGNAAGK